MPSSRQLIEDIYEQWSQGNFRAGLELLDPELTLEVHVPIPDAAVYEGLPGLQGYMRQFLGTWQDYEIRAAEIEEDGEQVIVLVHHRGKASGASVEAQFAMVWTVRNGHVVRIDVAQDRESGRAAALDASRGSE